LSPLLKIGTTLAIFNFVGPTYQASFNRFFGTVVSGVASYDEHNLTMFTDMSFYPLLEEFLKT
jgi:hypothetical protein